MLGFHIYVSVFCFFILDGYKAYWSATVSHIEWLKNYKEVPLSILSKPDITKHIVESYNLALRSMSTHLLKAAADFDLTEMIISIIIFFQVSFYL